MACRRATTSLSSTQTDIELPRSECRWAPVRGHWSAAARKPWNRAASWLERRRPREPNQYPRRVPWRRAGQCGVGRGCGMNDGETWSCMNQSSYSSQSEWADARVTFRRDVAPVGSRVGGTVSRCRGAKSWVADGGTIGSGHRNVSWSASIRTPATHCLDRCCGSPISRVFKTCAKTKYPASRSLRRISANGCPWS